MPGYEDLQEQKDLKSATAYANGCLDRDGKLQDPYFLKSHMYVRHWNFNNVLYAYYAVVQLPKYF